MIAEASRLVSPWMRMPFPEYRAWIALEAGDQSGL
jgi:hypothetical protein